MGPSGCGKSTLAKLLLGFIQPHEGVIKLDDKDIRFQSANELRNHFGVVPQETMLFSGTIYDNLTIANPHLDFNQIVNACQLAGIHETIEKLPEGYQTQIGEHGTGLSGGQKQRLAIARALLRQPDILIFDEAVSNLDPVTSEQFAQTINRLKGQVTILFITHQLLKALQVDEAILLGGDNNNQHEQEQDNQETSELELVKDNSKVKKEATNNESIQQRSNVSEISNRKTQSTEKKTKKKLQCKSEHNLRLVLQDGKFQFFCYRYDMRHLYILIQNLLSLFHQHTSTRKPS